jgi:hypothetical protein
MRGEEQRLTSARGVGAHEALADRAEGGELLFRQIGEADRLARIL